MTTVNATVSINLKGLKKFQAVIDADMEGGGNGPIRAAMKQWAYRYRSETQRAFVKKSRGAGWAALSPRTLAARRKGRGTGTPAILRDKGLLFNVLSPQFTGAPGQLENRIKFGVEVGFGGPAKHGDGGKATIADIAAFHQAGAGFLPQRKIIEPLTSQLRADMAADMQRALKKLSDDTIEGP